MGSFAKVLEDAASWPKVEHLHELIYTSRTNALAEDHPDVLLSMKNLATTYFHQGRFQEAEELQVEVIEGVQTGPRRS